MRTSVLGMLLASLMMAPAPLRAQDEEHIERPGPPPHDSFELDANEDGIPDGWYNLRDARLVNKGKEGIDGPTCVRFESDKPGRPARISRAFGIDGRQTEAVLIGLWVRAENVTFGERLGDEPGLLIDFLGSQLRTLGRGSLGPWTKTVGPNWVRVSKRIPVPPGTRDAIMSVGLLGATGVLEIDGLTIDLVPAGPKPTTNLILNGDFELGDPDPAEWVVDHGARRVVPDNRSSAVLELGRSGAQAMNGLGTPVDRLAAVQVAMRVRGVGLRGARGVTARFFFLDGTGAILPGSAEGVLLFRWSGSFDWREDRAICTIPRGAYAAVLQFDKFENSGSVRIDDIRIEATPDPQAGTWEPYHVQDNTAGWTPVMASTQIEPGSALDASFLLSAPAGKRGFVTVKDGRLVFERGARARFFGAAILAPAAFQKPEQADALAERLARSGINLVRLGDLDSPLGPSRSLFDDTRDDTKELDPLALERLDHLIAALKQRGIYIALELQSSRRYRDQDDVPGRRALPAGGGPAAAFDPEIRQSILDAAKALLTHVNPETGLALKDDPVLAWITLVGELSLFDLAELRGGLPPALDREYRSLVLKSPFGSSKRTLETIEAAQWKALAAELRKLGVKVPIAGCSHWRRDAAEFAAAQAAAGLDLIDDRLYWMPATWDRPEHRSPLWSRTGGFHAAAAQKRRKDRPYVVGQWADQTLGAWALPFEGADGMLAVMTARVEDWDGLVRRGIFLFPEVWGSAATGTGGGEDFFQVPGVINGNPALFALWPHAASVFLRGHDAARTTGQARSSTAKRASGLDLKGGRLVINTPFTQGLAGWTEGEPESFETLAVDIDNPYGVVVATSMAKEPIATTSRLLVTAIARIEPTGFRWVDQWRHHVAAPGTPPLLQEPVRAKIAWRHAGKIQAYALDNNGARVGPADLVKTANGVLLELDGSSPSMHWELVVE
jgi:hypothetical protein